MCSAASFLMMPLALTVSLVAFFAVGLVIVSLHLRSDWRVPPSLLALLVVACASAVGYGFFWIYFINPLWGRLTTVALVTFLFSCLIEAPSRMKVLRLFWLPDLWIPFALMLSAGLFLTAIAYLGVDSKTVCPNEDLLFVLRRLIPPGTGAGPDYLIQKHWVDGLSGGFPPWNMVLDPDGARTTVADRAPLLAGIVLMFNSLIPGSYRFVYFMAITSAASLAWIPAIWSLARSAGLNLTRTTALIATLTLLFYFLFSTVFSWPKALSGSLYVGAFILLFLERNSESTTTSLRSIILGAGFAGLAYVTHNSTGLLLLVTAALLLLPKRRLSLAHTIIAAGVFLAIAAPYTILKSTHEIAPSQLAKFTLTNNLIKTVPRSEFDAMSTLDAVNKYYSTLTLQEIIHFKVDNIAEIFIMPCLLQCADMSIKESQAMELMPIMASLKFFNFGWLITIPLLLMGSEILGLPSNWNRLQIVSRDCLSIALSGLLVYALIAFHHVTNIVSSGFILLLITALGIMIFSLPKKMIALFVVLVAANFIWYTVMIFREDHLALLYPMLALAFLAAAGLIFLILASIKLNNEDSVKNNTLDKGSADVGEHI
jgi:hypothetical protein